MKSTLLTLAALGGASAFVLPAGYSGHAAPLRVPDMPNFASPMVIRSADGTTGFSMPLHRIQKRDFNDPEQTKAFVHDEVNRLRLKYGGGSNATAPAKRDEQPKKRQTIGLTDYGRDR